MRPDSAKQVRARLRELAAEDAQTHPSGAVERRVMQAWDARATESPRWRRSRPLRWALAAACMSLIAVGLRLQMASGRPPVIVSEATPTAVSANAGREGAGAFAYLDDDPASLQVLRLRATPAILGRLGLPLSGLPDESPVTVEVVLAADGTARRAQVVGALEEH